MTRTIVLSLFFAVLGLVPGRGLHAQPAERVFSTFNSSNGLADNSAQTIKCTKTGRMVISTIGHINFYDGDAFTHIDPTAEDSYPLPAYNGHYHMYFDKRHHLWLKDKHTVTCLDLLTEKFIHDVGSVIKEVGMTDKVDDMFGDSNFRLWFLSGKTLHCVDLDIDVPILQKGELQDIDVWKDSLLLQFYDNGSVSLYDIKHHTPRGNYAALSETDATRYDKSSVLCPDQSDYYQIRNGTTEAVLLCFNVQSQTWEKVMSVPYHLNNMVMREKRLYVACEYGYWIYDTESRDFKHMESLRLMDGRKLMTDVNTLCFDRQGGMWIGTEKRGLLYSKPFKPLFTSYTWDNPEANRYATMLDALSAGNDQQALPRHVNCRITDSRGWTWSGTYTGLQVQKHDDKAPYTYTIKDGLINEMVRCVVEDDNHDIWVGTSYGISHLKIRNGEVAHVETYTKSDDVPDESFVNARAMKLHNGTIVMQSLDHMVTFNPEDFKMDSLINMKLYPKLIRLMINGQVVKEGTKINGKVILKHAVTRTFEFSTDYDKNTLSLTFSGLNFFRPIQTFYRIRVKGVYNDWKMLSYANSSGLVDKRGLLHLPLIGIKPGTYVVEVQTSLQPDVWPQEPIEWTIHVEEPWWRATGVYFLLAAVVIALALVNFYLQLRNTRLRMQCRNEENDTLKRIRNYAERCNNLSGEVLTPSNAQIGNQSDPDSYLDKGYVEAMLKIVPYVNEHAREEVTLRELSALVNMEDGQLYDLLAANLYRSPRLLISRLRLRKAAEMLRSTELTPEEIAQQCQFGSTNFFIASFFHIYKQTPADYRKKRHKPGLTPS